MSDGRFSAKPLRPEGNRPVVRTAGEFSTEARLSSDETRAFLQSRAVRREIDRLRDRSSPDRDGRWCDPLPRKTPSAALDMGRPLASARLVQEYLIGLLFLRVCGWFFMGCAALMLIGGAIGTITSIAGRGGDPNEPAIFAAVFLGVFALVIGGVGAWFGIFRGRVINEMCWFCPYGMIWLTEGHFDWYRWEDIQEVYCRPHAERPAVGICLGRNVSWISFADTAASRAMVEYIENQASLACASELVQLLAEGKSIRFGAWRLSRTYLQDPDAEIAWSDVVNLESDRGDLFLQKRDGGRFFARLAEIPFPSLFTALAQAIFAYSRERPS